MFKKLSKPLKGKIVVILLKNVERRSHKALNIIKVSFATMKMFLFRESKLVYIIVRADESKKKMFKNSK